MSTRNVRVSDVAKSLRTSWYNIDKLTKNGVLPCDRVLIGNKVARLYSIGECEQYFFIYKSLLDSGVAKHAAIIGVKHRQRASGVRNSSEVKNGVPNHGHVNAGDGVTIFNNNKNSSTKVITEDHNFTYRTLPRKEKDYEKISFIICLVILLLVVGALVSTLFLN